MRSRGSVKNAALRRGVTTRKAAISIINRYTALTLHGFKDVLNLRGLGCRNGGGVSAWPQAPSDAEETHHPMGHRTSSFERGLLKCVEE